MKIFALTLVATAVGVLTLPISAEAQITEKRAVKATDAPKAIGPYSDAIIANGFVFLAGKVGTDPKTGSLVPGGIVEQTEQALNNLEIALKAAGGTLDDIVKTTVFLADMNDFQKMNEVYAKRFKLPFPARSTVQVARLPRDAKVEIEAIALVRTESGSDRVRK